MNSHLSRFRVTYITAAVAVASAVGAEFLALKDVAPDVLHAKTWAFWVSLFSAVVVNAGNTILAALHPAPERRDAPAAPKTPAAGN